MKKVLLPIFYIVIGIILSVIFYFVSGLNNKQNIALPEGTYNVTNLKSQKWFGKKVKINHNIMTSEKNGKWYMTVNTENSASNRKTVVFQSKGESRGNIYSVKQEKNKYFLSSIIDGKIKNNSIILQLK